MIEAAGLAFPRAPLDAALAQLAAGSLFDALVVAAPEAGKFRLSVLGASLDLETALPLEIGERVRLAVKSTEPLTLEIRPAAAAKAEEGAAGPRPLSLELESAVRAFAGGDPVKESAARWMAARGLGVDPAAARGLAALATPGAVRVHGGEVPPADAAEIVSRAAAAIAGKPAGFLLQASEGATAAALQLLGGLAEFRALVEASPETAARASAALKALPAAREGLALLETGRALGEAARAIQVLNGDAAARGDGVSYFVIGWVRDGRSEFGVGRVERGPRGAADPDGPSRIVVTLDLSRLGPVQVAVGLTAAAASVTLAALSPASRRLLERDRHGLAEALVRLGLRPEVRFADGPFEPVLPMDASGLDVRA
ncbi:MAG: flagellar hook-length control protein FliK [Planctomycetes bacterium]|nr:flagellar hook-length control protein FliK [Planctomycetota bacterium]